MNSIYDQYWLVTVPIIIASGLVGTGLMELFIYFMTFITDNSTKFHGILGDLLTRKIKNRRRDAPFIFVVGILAQYVVGMLFMTCYFFLWKVDLGQPDFFTGIVFGIGSGILAVIFWRNIFNLNAPPAGVKVFPYLSILFFAHFVFVTGCFVTFNFLVSFK